MLGLFEEALPVFGGGGDLARVCGVDMCVGSCRGKVASCCWLQEICVGSRRGRVASYFGEIMVQRGSVASLPTSTT